MDKRLLRAVFSGGALTIFAATCTATLLTCEALSGLLAGIPLAAIETGAVCGLPTLTAALSRGSIAEKLEAGNLDTIELALQPYMPGMLAASPGAVLAAWHKTSQLSRLARQAAQLLAHSQEQARGQGRLAALRSPLQRLARKNAERLVSKYFDTLFNDYKELKGLPAEQKALIIRSLGEEGLAKTLAALRLADDETRSSIIRALETGDSDEIEGLLNTEDRPGPVAKVLGQKENLLTAAEKLTNPGEPEVENLEDGRVRYTYTVEGADRDAVQEIVDQIEKQEGVTVSIEKEGGRVKLVIEGPGERVKAFTENLKGEAKSIAESMAGEIKNEVDNAMRKVENPYQKGLKAQLKEALKGAGCTASAYIAATTAALAASGTPHITTLTLDVTDNTLTLGTLKVG